MKRKITLSLINLIVVIFLFITTTYAWMFANKDVSSSNGNMSLYYDEASVSIKYYKYDLSKEEVIETIASSENDYINVDFNQYDLIFTKRNEYTPIFAKIEICKTNKMPEDGSIHLTINRDTSITSDEEGTSANDLSLLSSTIIRFTACIDNSLNNYNDLKDLYNNKVNGKLYNDYANTEITEINNQNKISSNVFSKVDNSVFSKIDTLTLDISYTSSDFVTNNDEQILTVYLYMCYDLKLVNYYRNTKGIQIHDITNNLDDFKNDFDYLRISYDTSED